MTSIESTPEMAERVFARLSDNVARARDHHLRPFTLADKLLIGHLEDPDDDDLTPGRPLALRPDRVVFQDVLGQSGMLQLMQTRCERARVPTTIHCDHLIRARAGAAIDLKRSRDDNGEVYDFLRAAAARYGIGFWGPGAGIVHQVVLETYAFPGQMILGTDSHTPNAGGLGAFAIGVGGADAVEVVAGMPFELPAPRKIAVVLRGALAGWAAPKDIVLWVAGQLGCAGATHAVIEYIGSGARTLSATGKATITNMGAEVGATTSLFPADERMSLYLRATGRAEIAALADRYRALLEPDKEVLAAPDRYYDRVLELDLSALEPHVTGPHSPDRARPLSALAAEVGSGELIDTIESALIGSCTNSSYADMSRAADVATQAKAAGVRAACELLVAPGSEQIRRTIERDGQLTALLDVGATVLANACGPCIGQWDRERSGPTTIVTSFNRNFPGRNDGHTTTASFIASPEVVTALALAGRLSFNPLTDPLVRPDGSRWMLSPPAPAPEVPERGFVRDGSAYVAPPEDGGAHPIAIDPNSERLQRLSPWPRWSGEDWHGLPVLMKTRGKTTTDHISPAGKWLRYRGHLEAFSENLLSGATNAFTMERGTTRSVLGDEATRPVAAVAREYRARALPWVIVGDENYGEGSSREHAALSPRLLGGVAVIAKSFARIHESNLKKQGLLALTFEDGRDYERIRWNDRVSLVGLAGLAPGRRVECLLTHDDGEVESIWLLHSYTVRQRRWLEAGSALNAMDDR